jgi:hypothetical protein
LCVETHEGEFYIGTVGHIGGGLYSGEGEKLISGEEVLGIWSMCVTETEKFFPCGTNEALFFSATKTPRALRGH